MDAGEATYEAAAAGAGTQYAPSTNGLKFKHMRDVGAVIDHPTGNATTYTVQVSNMTDEQIRQGKNRWADYLVIGTKAAAAPETFFVDLDDPPFTRMRIKMDHASGADVVSIDFCVKG